MYADLFFMLLTHINDRNLGEYMDKNDVTELFEKYDEESIIILRGIESCVLGMSSNKKSKEYQSVFSKYKKQLYSAFIQNPYKFFDSYLFDNRYKVFSLFEQIKIKKVMKNLKKEIDEILTRGPKDEEENHFLMKYLKNHIDLDDNKQKEIIRKIIEKNVIPSDYEEKNFLINYVSKWMLKDKGLENLEVALFSGDFSRSTNTAGYAQKSFIFIGADATSLQDYLRIICHETQHVVQSEMEKRLETNRANHIESLEGLQYLEHSLFGSTFYNQNYYLSRIEYDADENGIEYTQKILKEFGIENIDNFINLYSDGHTCDFVISHLGGGEYEKEFSEYAYAAYWDMIIKNNPYLLSVYKFLDKIYDNNGNRKSFDEMINHDFSSEKDLYMFYNFVFCYIQEGALDKNVSNNKIAYNNILLIFNKVINRMSDFIDKGIFRLPSLKKTDEKGFKLSNSEVNDVYKSENFYYLSFLSKVSNYLYNHISELDETQRQTFIKKIEKVSELFQLSKKNLKMYCNLEDKDIQIITDKGKKVLFMYNDLRHDEVAKIYQKKLNELVPIEVQDTLINIDGKDYNLKEYVCSILPKFANTSDITLLELDNKTISFDNYILSLLSNSKERNKYLNDLLILSDLIKTPYNDHDFRNSLINYYNKIITHYEIEDKLYSIILKNILSNSVQYYQEHIMIDTRIDIKMEKFSDEVRGVIERSK